MQLWALLVHLCCQETCKRESLLKVGYWQRRALLVGGMAAPLHLGQAAVCTCLQGLENTEQQ